jgi:hypothetical protein
MDYPEDFNEDRLYDQFPRGDEFRTGPEEGYNTWVKINDRSLFTEDAQRNAVINEFLEAPFSVNFAQFKSSHRETEYLIHKPHRAMGGQVEGIKGRVDKFPEDPAKQRIATLVVNHELTLAKYITRSLTIEDGTVAGQMMHKQPEPPPEEAP